MKWCRKQTLRSFPGSSRSTSPRRWVSLSSGERTNITGSPKFSKLILAGDFRRRARRRASAGAGRRQHSRRQHGRRNDRFRSGHDSLSESDRQRTGNRAHPDHDRQLEVERDRGRTEMLQGKAVVNSISLKNGEEEFLRQARLLGVTARP